MSDAENLVATIEPEHGWLDLLDSTGQAGWQGLEFYLRIGGQTLVAGSGNRQTKADGSIHWLGRLTPEVDVRLSVTRSTGGNGWVVAPALCNRGCQEVAFDGYGFRVAQGQAGVRHPELVTRPFMRPLVYGHSENLRYERLPHCRVSYPFLRPLPATEEQVGLQASGPIPLLLLGTAYGRLWLAEGALSQRRHVLTWHLGLPQLRERLLNYRSEYAWTGGASEIVPAGGEVALESTLFCVFRSAPDSLYKPYIEELTRLHHFSGPQSRMGREPAFGTWNYFTKDPEIPTEARAFRQMDVVRQYQGGGYFQLDHGYEPIDPSGELLGFPFPTPEVDAFFPNPDAAWDPSRFPSGPKGFTAACRRRGLRPGLWWSPRVKRNGPLAAAHPQWILRDRQGKPIDVGHWFLDPSVPEAREFFQRCIAAITAEWGFEGIKLDFFSYMFDHVDAVFANGGTNVSWRRWLLDTIRTALGPQGYFLFGISVPMGNPFLAINGFDAFRIGYDVASGDWDLHVRNCSWLLPTALAVGRKTWFMDIDSCMGRPGIPEIERRSRCAFAYMTGSMLEFSGPIETLDQRALEDYRLLSSRCDQGGQVNCPDEAAFYGVPLPTVLVRHHDAESRTRQAGISHSIGLFNWSDTVQPMALLLSQLGIGSQHPRLRDFWSGETRATIDGLLTLSLPPRGHALLDVLV